MINQTIIIPEIKVEHHISYFLDGEQCGMGIWLLYLNGVYHSVYYSMEDLEKAIQLYISDELLKR